MKRRLYQTYKGDNKMLKKKNQEVEIEQVLTDEELAELQEQQAERNYKIKRTAKNVGFVALGASLASVAVLIIGTIGIKSEAIVDNYMNENLSKEGNEE